MVEIAIHDELGSPSLEEVSSRLFRIHIGMLHEQEDIVSILESSGRPDLIDLAIELFADDRIERVFQTTKSFVLVRKA